MGNDSSAEEERDATDSNCIPRDIPTNTQQIALHEAFRANNRTSQIFCTNITTNYPLDATELLKKRDGLQFSPFHHAVAGGHVDLVRFLLAKQVELGMYTTEEQAINEANKDGVTSLHIAVSCCHKDVLKVLLEKGGDANAKTTTGASPLHAACTYGDSKTDGGSVEMVKLLLQSGADLNAKTKTNQTPLFCVLSLRGDNDNLIRGQEDIALVLLGHNGVDVSGAIDGSTLLHLATSQGMDKLTKALLNRKASPNDPGPEGLYPIHLATRVGSAATAEALLSAGARADTLTPELESPLMLAITEESLELVKLFLEHGADVNRANEAYGSVLCYAARGGDLEITKYLLEKGASVALTDGKGNTALHIACLKQSANPKLLKVLFAAKINVNEKNNNEQTALHICCGQSRNGKALLALLAAGASVNEKDAKGNTALHVVANKGLVSMMKHLLDHGADVNAVNSEGKSPLHLCVEYGSVQGVKALLEKKATHTQVVRDAAAQKGIKEIEKLLSAAEESKI